MLFRSTGADKNPISIYLKQLAAIRAKYPALANGQMQIRYASGSQFAFSKLAAQGNREYVVALNNSSKPSKITLSTATNSDWSVILGSANVMRKNSELTLTIPGLTTVVLEAKKPITQAAFAIKSVKASEDFASGFFQVSAEISTLDFVRAEFFINKGTGDNWETLGIDQGSPYSVYIDPHEYSGALRIKVRASNSSGQVIESSPISLNIPQIK